MSSNTSDPLELLQCIEKQWVSRLNAHLIRKLGEMELLDRDLSPMYRYLDLLQRIEEEYGSFRVFSDNTHLLKKANRIHQKYWAPCFHDNNYPCLEGPDVTSTLERIAAKCHSFCKVLEGYHTLDTLQWIEVHWGSFHEFTDQYLSKSSHLLQTLWRTDAKCHSFCQFLAVLQSNKTDLLQSLQHIEQIWGSFRMYSGELKSRISNIRETTRRIGEECNSFRTFLETYLSSEDSLPRLEDELGSFHFVPRKSVEECRLLKRDLKFLGIILNLLIFKDEPRFIKDAQTLFQHAANNLIDIQARQSYNPFDDLFFLQHMFHHTKSEIRTSYSFPEVSFQLLANKDGIAIPNFVMEFIDTVVENLSDLLKFNDPTSLLFIERPMMGQIEKALEELKFLKSFVCFVSDRCIEAQSQHTFFNHILQVAWHTTLLAWLYFPSKGYQDAFADEINSIFSELIASSICKIYIGHLQALKLVQSQWYPVIQIKYIVDCEVGFVDTLLHSLEELPISSNFTAIKETLQEMLNLLRANFTKLHDLEFHLQETNAVIVDAGLLVYSVIDKNKDMDYMTLEEMNQVLVPDFRVEIQSMQAKIYLITRKTFLLQSNLPGIDGVGSADFILDNREMLLSLYSNSVDSVKRQLQTIQEELKCFQAVVEQEGLQHFVTQTNGLVYEVEYIFDSCKKKDFPDWCLFLWILNFGEDIRVLMAEVAELQEKNVFDLVLHNTTNASNADTSSEFVRNPDMNEEMVGRKDVMDKLKRKLTAGSSKLDVISIAGMPGVGKTTLANKLYFDQSVVSHFDICAQACVSQQYTQKNVLLTILGDPIGETAKLAESVLRDKLRKKLCGKRYLIFIDDIWETRTWDDLRICFPDDKKGSRIILTTRDCEVASYAELVSDCLDLQLLSNDESWMLLKKKVFNEEICPLNLQDVGERISKNCGGLPLAIVLVAGVLTRMDKKEGCWDQVATNIGSHIQDRSNGTIDLSYQNLEKDLRPCFLYFGVFSEGREIQVSKLTWLWISEGFVTTQEGKPLEDKANEHLENLVGRNLIIVAKRSFDGKIKACRIHDLLLEFCRKKAQLENFLESIKGYSGVDPSHVFCPPKYRTPRRLSLHSQSNNLEKWCFSFSHVKSFQFREAKNIAVSMVDRASFMFKRFKFLRVLDLEFTIIDFLPQELTLLRYLAFRTIEDKLSLPASLWNLETLIVQGLNGRVSVSDTIWEMVKLRHLHIYEQAIFILDSEELSESASTMDDLQTISSACFSCLDNANKILAKTPNLQKLRCEVSKLGGLLPTFNTLTMLKMLKISSGPTLTPINQLKLPSHLKKLTLSNFSINLNEVTTLSNLEVLKLQGVTWNSWEVNDEQFCKLKILKLENPSLSKWDVSDDAFPCLEHLVLKRCRYLREIPSCFGDMMSLKSIEVKLCKEESLAESALAIQKMKVEDMGYYDFKVFIHK